MDWLSRIWLTKELQSLSDRISTIINTVTGQFGGELFFVGSCSTVVSIHGFPLSSGGWRAGGLEDCPSILEFCYSMDSQTQHIMCIVIAMVVISANRHEIEGGSVVVIRRCFRRIERTSGERRIDMIKTAIKTRAYAAAGPGEVLKPFEVERREPGPSDVLIDVKFCGVCHSDVHQVKDEWGNAKFPMVPGHEIAGIVSKVGDQVKRFKEGDRVGVGCMVDSCKECDSCKAGEEQYCEIRPVLTYNDVGLDGETATYGGYSQRITVPERFVVRIPDNLPLDKAAPLLCAGITTYSPLRHWQAGSEREVAVVGLGGLGHMAVKLAHAMGARVTVISRSFSKKADAEAMGASDYVATSDSASVERAQNCFDLIINTVSSPADMNTYLGMLRRDGVMVLVGAPSEDLPVSPFSLIPKRKSLSGSTIGGMVETQEMLDFCGKHNITSDIELISIDKINEAYERLLKSDVRYRFVIDIGSLK